MPIQPPTFEDLTDIYQRLDDEVNTLQDAALAVASPAARQVLCSVGGALSLGFGGLGRLSSPGLAGMLDKAGGLLQRACEFPPPLPPIGPTPPFSGGQCAGVAYNYAGTWTLFNSDGSVNTNSTFQGQLFGPIEGPKPAGTLAGLDPNPAALEVIGRNASGQRIANPAGGSSNRTRTLVVNSFTVSVVGGGPDTCGDPEPVPPPPPPPIVQPPSSDPIPRVDPDGNPLPPIVFSPKVGPIYVDVDGSLNIPVEVNVNGPDVNVNIPVAVNLGDFSPTLIGPITGGGSGPGEQPGPPIRICCEGPTERTREGEEEDPEEEPEEAPRDMTITAVLVSSTPEEGRQSNSTIFTAAPPLLVPRIATVQFEVEVEGQRFIGPDVQVKQRRQLVEAPSEARVTRAFVRWEPGWSGSFVYLERARNDPFPTIAEE